MSERTTTQEAAGYAMLRWVGRYLPAALLLLAIALFVPRLLSFGQIATTFVAWPWQFDYTEGVNLSASVQLAQGRNIYAHNGPDSFVSAPYTPLFFLLTAPAALLSGPSFFFGRALSLAATLAIAFLLVYAARLDSQPAGGAIRRHERWLGGLLAAALWLSLSPVIVWAALYTQHMLALALGFGGLVWAMRHPGGRAIYWAAALLALAFFAKQSAFDAAGAVVAWLLLRDWRSGLRFGATLAGAIGLPFLAGNILTNGGLWEHAFGNQALPWSERRFRRLLDRLWGEHWPLLGLGLACVAATLASLSPQKRGRLGFAFRLKEAWGLAAIYFAFALASVLVRLGREGVNYNHMLDVLLPACLMAGMCAGRLVGMGSLRASPAPGKSWAWRVGGLALGGILLSAQAFMLADPHSWYLGAWPDPQLDKRMAALSRLVRETPGDIYSEDTYLALSNGRRVLYDDAFMFTNLAAQGRWDDSIFVQSLRDRRFSLVLLQADSNRLPPAARKALDESYDLKFADLITTYAPRAVPLGPQYPLACALQRGGDLVSLEGYSLGPGVAWNGVTPGDVLRVSLYWKPQRPISESYATHVHIINSANSAVLSVDNPQTGAGKPTNEWTPGQTITDTLAIPVTGDVAPGRYRLIAGMYLARDGRIEPLAPTCEGSDLFATAVLLGEIELKR